MKTRYGFVSNSSSTSFTCDICNETQSGMDLSRSEAGMQECRNNHTFCDEHALTPTISDDRKREVLIAEQEKWRTASWKEPGEVDTKIAEIKATGNGQLDDMFVEYQCDEGCVPEYCPICQMRDVDDGDVVRFALKKLGFANRKTLASALKNEFGTYDKFLEYLKT